MFDIIFFAIVSYFLFKKLKAILGEEYDSEFFGYNSTPREGNKTKDAEKVTENESLFDGFDYLSNESKQHAIEILKLIEKQSGKFTLKSFQQIAMKVLETTIEANNNQDKKTIKQFFAPSLANLACQAFNQDAKNNIVLVSIKNAIIKDIMKSGSKKFIISVVFKTEQINYTTNNNGDVIEGSKQSVEPVNEIWYFSHDFSTTNITWFVEKIEEN